MHELFPQVFVATAVGGPPHDVEHLARREIDRGVGEVVGVLGDVEQSEDDMLVGRRRQTVAGRRREGDALTDALVADGVVARGLELQAVALATVGVAGCWRWRAEIGKSARFISSRPSWYFLSPSLGFIIAYY